jgi:hypothetical protein
MLPQTPYDVTIEDLSVTVNHLYIELLYFIHPICTFKDDVFPLTHINGSYTDKEFQTSMDMVVNIVISGTIPTDQRLSFRGSFSVRGKKPLAIPNVSVKLAQYCFKIMDNYIIDKPLVDKDGKLFVIPKFPYGEVDFESVVFG